jgi:hypothetical protein
MTPMPSFEFCAFRFLAQWEENEYALYNAIRSTPTEKDIRKALSYFQVARNFEGLKEAANAAFVVQSLLEVRADQALSSPPEKVHQLVKTLETRFKQNNLSAASKLLWLSYRHPYIVYDNRAITALRDEFGHRFEERDYSAYSKVWREEYVIFEASIQSAVEQLPKGRMFMRACPLSDQELVRRAKETWFLERVFDIFLWEIGGLTNGGDTNE